MLRITKIMQIKNKTFLKIYVSVGTTLTAAFGVLAMALTGQGTLFQGKLNVDVTQQNIQASATNGDLIILPLSALQGKTLTANKINELWQLQLDAINPISFSKNNYITFNLESDKGLGNVQDCFLNYNDQINDKITLVGTSAPKVKFEAANKKEVGKLKFNFLQPIALLAHEKAIFVLSCQVGAKIEGQEIEISLLSGKEEPLLEPAIIYTNQKKQSVPYDAPFTFLGPVATF